MNAKHSLCYGVRKGHKAHLYLEKAGSQLAPWSLMGQFLLNMN